MKREVREALKEKGVRLPDGATSERTANLAPLVKDMFHKDHLPKTRIAHELKMSQDTVRRILKEDSKVGVANALSTVHRYLPQVADMVMKRIIKTQNVQHGIEIMEKAGVFPQTNAAPQGFSDPKLMIAINNLLPSNAKREVKVEKVAQVVDAVRGESAPVAEVAPAEAVAQQVIA